MVSIFTNKERLTNTYREQFLKKLSDMEQLKQCILNRYNKKQMTDDQLRLMFTNNHKVIYEFMGQSNQDRIQYFFGSPNDYDRRDTQIRLIDKFILDSIHFEISSQLIEQLNKDYTLNASSINQTWLDDIEEKHELGPIEPLILIHRALGKRKKPYYDDLVLSAQSMHALFRFDKKQVIPNAEVFAAWLPRKKTIHRGIICALIAIPLGIILISAFALKGTMVGLTAAVSISYPPIILGCALISLLALIPYISSTKTINEEQRYSSQRRETIKPHNKTQNPQAPSPSKPTDFMGMGFFKKEHEATSKAHSDDPKQILKTNP